MPNIKQLLIEQLQDILHAETQLTAALPKMADAAHHPKLKEAFEKHLVQTQGHVERLRKAFEVLGAPAETKPCKGMMGLIEEGEETMEEGAERDANIADLALIAAAQKVEHYEISAYGTARSLARQLGALDCTRLLTLTLGEEESTDYLLTAISDPLIQQASLDDAGADVNLEAQSVTTKRAPAQRRRTQKSDAA